jgi:hypothetical protein
MSGLTDLRLDTTLLTEMQLVTARVLIQTVDDWKNNRLLQEMKLRDICKGDETGLFFNLQLSKSLTIRGDPCHGKTKSKQHDIQLLACNADGSDNYHHL